MSSPGALTSMENAKARNKKEGRNWTPGDEKKEKEKEKEREEDDEEKDDDGNHRISFVLFKKKKEGKMELRFR